jgi:hypothetical protein
MKRDWWTPFNSHLHHGDTEKTKDLNRKEPEDFDESRFTGLFL